MLGTGTLLDPYIIQDVNDLQAIDGLGLKDVYCELGNDIDATATAGWNAGRGFIPWGMTDGATSNQFDTGNAYPDSDVSQNGAWTRVPAAAGYYDKIDEAVQDDADYVQCVGIGDIEFGIDLTTTPAPADTGSAQLRILWRAKRTSGGTTKARVFIVIGGTRYNVSASGTSLGVAFANITTSMATNPATGLDWTATEINSITNIGIECLSAGETAQISRVYVYKRYVRTFQGGGLDGKNYKITGLTINRPASSYQALISTAGITSYVKNVNFVTPDITGDYYVGALAGLVESGFTLDNMRHSGATLVATGFVGGLIGDIVGPGTIDGCYGESDITSVDGYAGGIVGHAEGGVAFSDCCGYDCVMSGEAFLGAVLGRAEGDVTFDECFSVNNAITTNGAAPRYMGGIVGYCRAGTNIYFNKNYDYKSVLAPVASYNAGGISGGDEENGITDAYAMLIDIATEYNGGGILGSGENPITNAYAVPTINGDNTLGGIVGFLFNGGGTVPITACFFDSDVGTVTGLALTGDIVGDPAGSSLVNCHSETTTNMKTRSTFTIVGWDFTTIWYIGPNYNHGYPCFRGMPCFPFFYNGVWVESPGEIPGYAVLWGIPEADIWTGSIPAIAAASVRTDSVAVGANLTSATLGGQLLDDGGENCTCGFQWGVTASLGNTTSTQSLATNEYPSQIISGLVPYHTYYYRAFATNSFGTSYGTTRSFFTAPGGGGGSGGGSTPEDIIRLNAKVQTLQPSNLDSNAATMNGQVVDALGYYGDVYFEYGTSTLYGSRTTSQQSFSTGDSFNARISLGEGRAYHYRAAMVIKGVTVYGGDVAINTPSTLGPVTFIGGDIFPDEDD